VTGDVNFADKFINLDPSKGMTNGVPVSSLVQAKAAGTPVIAYGQFINNVIDFLIVAFCVFLMVKAINELRRRFEKQQEAAPAPGPTPTEALLTEIRDVLKQRK
jgi:large conductance mechanosensitive channel